MFFSKKVEQQLILILDVESTLVGGSLVVVSPDSLPRIIFSHTANITFDPGMDNNKLIKATLASINEVIQTANASLHARKRAENLLPIPKKITSVHYVLSSPWIISEAKVMKLGFEKEKTITRKFISDLVNDDRSKITSTKKEESLEVIEQKIFDVRLNGYSVADWEDKTTRSLEVAFTVSVAGSKMIELFIDAVKPLVYQSKVHFHSSLLLQYITIEKVLSFGPNYCLVHAHGDYTDIFIVHEKSCVYFGSYPVGIRTILAMLAAKTNNHEQALDSLISLYMNDKLDDVNYKKICEAIGGVVVDWVGGLKALLDQSKVEMKPSTSMVLNSLFYESCLLRVLQETSPQAMISTLPIEGLLPHVAVEDFVEKNRLQILQSIAIHSLIV